MTHNAVDEREIVEDVVRRTGLTEEKARQAVRVVAGELGQALTWGEAVNVADHLGGAPGRAMREAAPTTGGSNRYSAAMFLHIVGERLGVDGDTAARHTAGILLSLRDLLPGDRFAAIVEELPNHAALLGGPVAGRTRPQEPPVGEGAAS